MHNGAEALAERRRTASNTRFYDAGIEGVLPETDGLSPIQLAGLRPTSTTWRWDTSTSRMRWTGGSHNGQPRRPAPPWRRNSPAPGAMWSRSTRRAGETGEAHGDLAPGRAALPPAEHEDRSLFRAGRVYAAASIGAARDTNEAAAEAPVWWNYPLTGMLPFDRSDLDTVLLGRSARCCAWLVRNLTTAAEYAVEAGEQWPPGAGTRVMADLFARDVRYRERANSITRSCSASSGSRWTAHHEAIVEGWTVLWTKHTAVD